MIELTSNVGSQPIKQSYPSPKRAALIELESSLGSTGEVRLQWEQAGGTIDPGLAHYYLSSRSRQALDDDPTVQAGYGTAWLSEYLFRLPRAEEEYVPERPPAEVGVYPGFRLTRREYERRFAGFPLEDYRKRMKPEVFRWFVKAAAVVEGVPGPRPDQALEDYA